MRFGKIGCARMMKKWTARDYVQDGLIAMWDGIENAGWGVHDASAASWKELMGTNNDFQIPNNNTWGEDSLQIATGMTSPLKLPNSVRTIEVVMDAGEFRAYDGIFFGMDGVVYGSVYGSPRKFLPYTRDGVNVFILGTGQHCPIISDNKYPRQIIWSFNERGITTNIKFDGIAPEMSTFVEGQGNNSDGVGIYAMRGGYTWRIQNIRCYNRALTATEIAANYKIDKIRFNLP